VLAGPGVKREIGFSAEYNGNPVIFLEFCRIEIVDPRLKTV
jgi:hypothetical protein